MTNIALVDDESNILTSVSLALETEGFNVDTFKNGEEAIQALENKKYDLGLFDIKMPRMNGNELLMKVRSSSNLELRNLPIIFLTSKDQEQDEIIGLKMGAADYIKKGDLLLDDLKQLCFWKNTSIELTVAEFNLIKSLAKHPGVIKDRNQLMDAMYGEAIYVDDRTIDSHIKRLRKKFKSYDPTFDQIRTRYGSGYSWRE